jgi:phage tail-like protein
MAVATYDPLLGFKFLVEIPKLSGAVFGFQKVSGLSLDVGILEVTEISNPVTVTKLPDRISFSDLTLERGASPSTGYADLWSWFKLVEAALNDGYPADFRMQVNIKTAPKGILLDSQDPSVREWHVYNAFPKTVKFGEFDATSSAVLIESLTLANEGYRLI